MLLLSVCLLDCTVVIFSGSGPVGGAVLVVVVVVVMVVVDGVGIVVVEGAAEVDPFSVNDVRVCDAEGFWVVSEISSRKITESLWREADRFVVGSLGEDPFEALRDLLSTPPFCHPMLARCDILQGEVRERKRQQTKLKRQKRRDVNLFIRQQLRFELAAASRANK